LLIDEVTFETAMSRRGASVFSFDCTVQDNVAWKDLFQFYPWCIGKKTSFENNIYTANLNESTLIFKSLGEIKKILGHHRIDIFKFDIEGFEWGLFESEIIAGDDNDLPTVSYVTLAVSSSVMCNPHLLVVRNCCSSYIRTKQILYLCHRM
jgi:hypothetical protein